MKSTESLISLYKDPQGAYQVEVRDFQRATDQYYALRRIPIQSDKEIEGNFVSQENNIYFPVVNRQLNLIGDSWRYNPFKSTTPVLTVNVDTQQAVVNDTYIKASGSLMVKPSLTTQTNFTVEIYVGVTLITFTLSFNDPFFLLTAQEQSEYLSKRIYIEILTAYGITPPDIENIDHGTSAVIMVNGDNVDLMYVKAEGLLNDPSGTLGEVSGVLFTMQQPKEVFITISARYTAIPGISANIFYSYNIDSGRGGLAGEDAIQNDLEAFQEYWYTARYIYSDGHKTKTSFPVYAKTDNNKRLVSLNILAASDLDGTFADIEIFRKTAASEFYNIDRLRNPQPGGDGWVRFVDDGKVDQFLFEPNEYIWTEEHKTHAIVRDRYVRANVKYLSRENDTTASVILEDTEDEESVPPNTRIELYTKKKFIDGLDSFHRKNGFIPYEYDEPGEDYKKFKLTLNNPGLNTKEVGYYVKYNKIDSPIQFPISSPILYNIKTSFYKEVDEKFERLSNLQSYGGIDVPRENPSLPHLFIGYKYLYRFRGYRTPTGNTAGGYTNSYFYQFYDQIQMNEEFKFAILHFPLVKNYFTDEPVSETTLGAPPYVYIDEIVQTSYNAVGNPELNNNVIGVYNNYSLNEGSPYRKIKIPKLVYRLVERESTEPARRYWVYEAVCIDGLKTLANTERLKLKISSFEQIQGVSTKRVENKEVTVVDIVSLSEPFDRETDPDRLNFFTPKDVSRLYLVLEDDEDLQNVEKLINIDASLVGVFDIDDLDPVEDNVVNLIDQTNRFTLVNTNFENPQDNALIYIGNSRQQSPVTGYEKINQNNAIYWQLKESNIYENLITLNDLNNYQQDYPNQIIWSEPFLLGADITGSRNFTFVNVLNIQRDYGDIIHIEALQNRLIVFTERAIGVVLVGEQLTEAPSGQTFISGINFLNSPTWIFKDLEGIEVNTIKSYQDAVYFCDGETVYRISQGIEDISKKKILLGGNKRISGYPGQVQSIAVSRNQWAIIDPDEGEYRITSGSKTYCYNIESGEWTGPHDYRQQTSGYYKFRSFGVSDGELIEHNIGNYRGEAEYGPDKEYETEIVSTGNDMGDAWVTKLFRKFYIEATGDSEFGYSKDKSDWETKQTQDSISKNGLRHIGIKPGHQNSRYIFWRFITQAEDFLLKLLSFEYTRRDRR